MVRVSNKHMHLYNTQDIEPLFAYYDDVRGLYNFGLVRLGVTDVHITTALRKSHKKGLVIITNQEVELGMKTINTKTGFRIELAKGLNRNVEDLRKKFNDEYLSP